MVANTRKDPTEDESPHGGTLRRLQRDSFEYFTCEVDRQTGLVLDKTAPGWPASIAAMGMALTVYIVGTHRGFIERHEAAARTLAMLRFLEASEQSESPQATGYRGFYYHFLQMDSGRRAWHCELSSIDTALLIAGVLAAGEYYERDDEQEVQIRSLARTLYERVDWRWMLNGQATMCHGWRPEAGFLPYRWQGYDEALILYLLALGSSTHAIDPSSYQAWCSTYDWKKIFDQEFLYAGPLFIHQMSHIWCDFQGIRDPYMRERDCDYFENSRRATLVQQQYAIRNSTDIPHRNALSWGITASDGPGNLTKKVAGVERTFYGYVARGAPFGPDDGTNAPWAVAASLPFAPEIVCPTISHMKALHIRVPNPYGFKASFNPLFPDSGTENGVGWVSPYHFGINEGPTVLMIENYRSHLIWELMRRCAALRRGLLAADFKGGWLDT